MKVYCNLPLRRISGDAASTVLGTFGRPIGEADTGNVATTQTRAEQTSNSQAPAQTARPEIYFWIFSASAAARKVSNGSSWSALIQPPTYAGCWPGSEGTRALPEPGTRNREPPPC